MRAALVLLAFSALLAVANAQFTTYAAPSAITVSWRAANSSDEFWALAKAAQAGTPNGDIFTLIGTGLPGAFANRLSMTAGQSIAFTMVANLPAYHKFTVYNSATPSGGTTDGALLTPVGGGSTLTFSPTVAGTYSYGCSVDGHTYMGNTITVAAAAPAGVPSTRGTATICDYYAQRYYNKVNVTAQEQYAFIKTLVNNAATSQSGVNGATFNGLLYDSVTKDFFNGVKQYRYPTDPTYNQAPTGTTSPNYLGNVPAGSTEFLVDHLTRYFGMTGVLDCSLLATNGFAYNNIGSQYSIHRNMNISKSVFNQFNSILGQTALSLNVSTDDINNIVVPRLLSFNRQNNANGPTANVICTVSTGTDACDCAPGFTGANCDNATPVNGAASASASMLALLLAAVASLLALRS